ncbi:hypothetical protein [Kribbella speibonae]|uniref:Uncharacterized protein n=1 Tax=Kribbella speibonae TaxID=1572660 RepID=A0A4R0IC83_9ACTN|nr:hypothetical protein [Kribbella speibonae]TCC29470.1 hypothetical protein E0H92_41300 [Kribbella speibonae]
MNVAGFTVCTGFGGVTFVVVVVVVVVRGGGGAAVVFGGGGGTLLGAVVGSEVADLVATGAAVVGPSPPCVSFTARNTPPAATTASTATTKNAVPPDLFRGG